MRPVHVTTAVPNPREEVYDLLDVMANHEPFTNHMLREWEYSGPERGVGSKAKVSVSAADRTDTIEIEVVAAERPTRIVERNIGASGRRVAHGTYTLVELPNGGTQINFEYAWETAPFGERLASPLVRGILRRGNQRAMARLAEQLAARNTAEATC